MGYKVKVEGFESQDIEVRINFWTGAKLFINGQRAKKGLKRGQMLLKNDAEQDVIAQFQYKNLWADVPHLKVGQKSIELAKPLTWKEWIFVGAPIILLFLGGALGAIMAMFGLYLNGKFFRSELNVTLKYLLSVLVTLLLVLAYFILSAIIITLFGNP